VVTLEYHNYQNDSKYFELEEHPEYRDFDEHHPNPADLLKTYLFAGAAANSNSQFDNKKEDVSYYKLDRSKDLLGMEKAKKEESSFSIVHGEAMIDGGSVADIYDKTTNGSAEQGRKAMKKRAGKKEEDANYKNLRNAEETMLSQCIMAIYKVNAAGGMRRFAEVDVDMGRRFFSSQDGNMTLTRSYDKKLISLANFEQEHANKEYFKIKAWTTKLGAFDLN
jgi:hypothetical protein